MDLNGCCARGRPIIVEWERRKAFGGPLSFGDSSLRYRALHFQSDSQPQPNLRRCHVKNSCYAKTGNGEQLITPESNEEKARTNGVQHKPDDIVAAERTRLPREVLAGPAAARCSASHSATRIMQFVTDATGVRPRRRAPDTIIYAIRRPLESAAARMTAPPLLAAAAARPHAPPADPVHLAGNFIKICIDGYRTYFFRVAVTASGERRDRHTASLNSTLRPSRVLPLEFNSLDPQSFRCRRKLEFFREPLGARPARAGGARGRAGGARDTLLINYRHPPRIASAAALLYRLSFLGELPFAPVHNLCTLCTRSITRIAINLVPGRAGPDRRRRLRIIGLLMRRPHLHSAAFASERARTYLATRHTLCRFRGRFEFYVNFGYGFPLPPQSEF
ncbi:hypothetical protein EVAR_64089_1 [Eumeta japonica]|uniref:Uncharacterized protein n=1 Tax=Eumeta variegata TaxID=151549 RepID=A0A4C1ZGM1_EUMVA|nr:hypothetical protein EVAR_64089_1 [Eumeta japonica]